MLHCQMKYELVNNKIGKKVLCLGLGRQHNAIQKTVTPASEVRCLIPAPLTMPELSFGL